MFSYLFGGCFSLLNCYFIDLLGHLHDKRINRKGINKIHRNLTALQQNLISISQSTSISSLTDFPSSPISNSISFSSHSNMNQLSSTSTMLSSSNGVNNTSSSSSSSSQLLLYQSPTTNLEHARQYYQLLTLTREVIRNEKE